MDIEEEKKMKKKLIFSGVALLSTLTLAACSNNNTTNNTGASTEVSTIQSSTTTSQTVENSTSSEQTTTYPASAYKVAPFDASIPNGNGYQIKNITKTTGSLDNKPILVIEMTFTNNGQTPISPYSAFIVSWNAQQTNGTTTTTLLGANGQMGNIENQEAVAMGDTMVNPGSTVDAIIGYSLADENADVGFILRTTEITNNPQGFAWANK